jgi:cyclase
VEASEVSNHELTPLGNKPAFPGGAQLIADACWAWIQPNGDLGESNAGLILGERESALVDTLWDERLTRRMLEALAEPRAGAPIRTVINTHGDGDHWYGNGLLTGAKIVASASAAEQMKEEPPSMLTRMRPLPGVASRLSGLPLIPGRARLRGLASFGEALSCYEFGGLSPRLPDRTFNGELVLDVGGRRVELIEVGPAHTPGDTLVWVPDASTVYAGDIVFNGVTPIMWAGPVANWIAALERIAALEPEVVVGGHGPVCELGPVEDLRSYWSYLAHHVPEGASNAVVELTEELVLAAEYQTSPWGGWRAPERTLVNVTMIARERDGETGPVGIGKRINLLAEMGALRERLDEAGAT